MEEILKAIAAANGWSYLYGRTDFQNLFNEDTEQKVCMFVDPITLSDVMNDAGVTEQVKNTGNFMLLLSSDLDEIDYYTRYETYIKPLITIAMQAVKDALRCNDSVIVKKLETTEVINMLDNNGDGIICSFEVYEDAD